MKKLLMLQQTNVLMSCTHVPNEATSKRLWRWVIQATLKGYGAIGGGGAITHWVVPFHTCTSETAAQGNKFAGIPETTAWCLNCLQKDSCVHFSYFQHNRHKIRKHFGLLRTLKGSHKRFPNVSSKKETQITVYPKQIKSLHSTVKKIISCQFQQRNRTSLQFGIA